MKERIKKEIDKIKKEFNKLIKKQGKQKIITYLYFIFSLIAITVFGLFAIGPTLDTLSDLETEREESKSTLEKLKTKVSNLQKLEAQKNSIENDLDLIYLAIPKSPKIPELTRKVEILANSNNLEIQSLNTGAIELYPASRSTSPLFSFTISINAAGSESNVNNFIKEFINFDRLISIERISTGNQEGNLFSTNIAGRAFFIKE